MRSIEQAVEVRVDSLTATSKVNQDGLLTSVALISLQSGDGSPGGLGAIGGAASES